MTVTSRCDGPEARLPGEQLTDAGPLSGAPEHQVPSLGSASAGEQGDHRAWVEKRHVQGHLVRWNPPVKKQSLTETLPKAVPGRRPLQKGGRGKGASARKSESSLEDRKVSGDKGFPLAELQCFHWLACCWARGRSAFLLLGWPSTCTSSLGARGTPLPVGVTLLGPVTGLIDGGFLFGVIDSVLFEATEGMS